MLCGQKSVCEGWVLFSVTGRPLKVTLTFEKREGVEGLRAHRESLWPSG